MRILFSAVLAAALAAGPLSALAQTAAPAKPKACKTLKKEEACNARMDCGWSKQNDPKGKCATKPKTM